MTELYWLTTLGKLSEVFAVLGCIILVAFMIAVCFSPLIKESLDDASDGVRKTVWRIIKGSIITGFVCLFGYIFVPSTTQLYAIYGIGTVIDYAQGSEEAKKIPDNAVKAINKYLESLGEDKDTKK